MYKQAPSKLTLGDTGNNHLNWAVVVGHCHCRIGKPWRSWRGSRNGAANATFALISKSNAALGGLFDDVSIRLGIGVRVGVCTDGRSRHHRAKVDDLTKKCDLWVSRRYNWSWAIPDVKWTKSAPRKQQSSHQLQQQQHRSSIKQCGHTAADIIACHIALHTNFSYSFSFHFFAYLLAHFHSPSSLSLSLLLPLLLLASVQFHYYYYYYYYLSAWWGGQQ